jgi:hypothetical protein
MYRVNHQVNPRATLCPCRQAGLWSVVHFYFKSDSYRLKRESKTGRSYKSMQFLTFAPQNKILPNHEHS